VSKQSLLLVDGDPRSLRVLEVSLKKAGFNVTTASNGRDALEKVELAPPDLVICETQLEELDGFAFCQKLKSSPGWAEIPFVFLTAQTDVATKIRGLELGVDDYLTKPIYIREIVARARILLQKRQRARIEERRDGRTRFSGHLSDIPIVDLIQTVEISRKTGLIQFVGEGGKQAAIYFRDGKVIDGEAGPLQAEDAVYRLLTWNDGEFEVVFRTVRRRDAITMSPQALLMEGMRRLDEWGRLCEQLPPLETRFEIDARELASRLGEIQDEHNTILRLFDGRRSVLEVIDACDYGDLESLEVIARLYFEGVLVEATSSKPTLSGDWVVPAMPSVPDPTPMEGGAVGLFGEDDEDDASVASAGAGAAVPTVSGEWTLDSSHAVAPADAPKPSAPPEPSASPRTTVTRLPTLPRTLSPTKVPDVVPSVPTLPSIGAAPARPSLIQKAIDDSDAIPLGELERELARQERPRTSSPELEVPPASAAPASAAKAGPAASREPGRAAGGAAKAAPTVVAESPGRTGAAPTSPPAARLESAERGDSAVAAAAVAAAATTAAAAAAPAAAATTAAAAAAPTAAAAAAPAVVPGAGATAETLPNAVRPDRGAVTAGRARRPSSEVPRSPRAPVQGHAKLVTEPPPTRAPAGSQRLRTERDEHVVRTLGAEAAEPVPPNRRGARWPAVLTGLVVLAGAGYALWRVRGAAPRRAPAIALPSDGGVPPPVDAAAVAPPPVDAAAVAPPPVDAAAVAPPPVDAAAGPRVIDAGVRPAPAPPRPPAGDERKRRLDTARRLLATDPQQALDIVDSVLDEQRSARALVVRADALLRLGRTGAALSAADAAIGMSPRYAPAWQVKGKALVAAGRPHEARPALVRYLDLQPTGPEADAVRRILDRP
jgi:DNA-binding response OmpR family regulator